MNLEMNILLRVAEPWALALLPLVVLPWLAAARRPLTFSWLDIVPRDAASVWLDRGLRALAFADDRCHHARDQPACTARNIRSSASAAAPRSRCCSTAAAAWTRRS